MLDSTYQDFFSITKFPAQLQSPAYCQLRYMCDRSCSTQFWISVAVIVHTRCIIVRPSTTVDGSFSCHLDSLHPPQPSTPAHVRFSVQLMNHLDSKESLQRGVSASWKMLHTCLSQDVVAWNLQPDKPSLKNIPCLLVLTQLDSRDGSTAKTISCG